MSKMLDEFLIQPYRAETSAATLKTRQPAPRLQKPSYVTCKSPVIKPTPCRGRAQSSPRVEVEPGKTFAPRSPKHACFLEIEFKPVSGSTDMRAVRARGAVVPPCHLLFVRICSSAVSVVTGGSGCSGSVTALFG